MTHVDIEKFKAMSKRIMAEQKALKLRLAEINEALGVTAPSRSTPSLPGRPTDGRSAGRITMREAITAALQAGPLKMKHLVPAVQDLGFVFTTSNPMNSLGAYLYSPTGKQHFTRTEQGFLPR